MMENNFLCRGKRHSQSRLQLATFLLVCGATTFPTYSAAVVCPENQTAELGGQGYISCNFPDDFSSVYWFDDASDKSPVIRLETDSGVRSGLGFDSGDYDIHQNGSLVISNVTAWHERVYRAIVYTGIPFDTYLVSLKVIASPVDDLPMIPCHNCHQEYYYIAMHGEILSCSFNATRPPVQLGWFKKFGGGYEHLEMQQLNITENSNGTFNALATVHLLEVSRNFIHLLMCRATWPLSDWRRERETLVDFSSITSFSDVTTMVQQMEIHRYAKVQGGQSASDYAVWKRIIPNRGPEMIGFHSHVMTKTISDIPDVQVSTEGSLMFASPSVQHEGMYVCISGDGQKEEIQMTSLEILIPPSPPYVQITGCKDVSHRCVIREDSTKNLTCAVYGARPDVTLEWTTEDEDISFFNDKPVFKERGETSDTTLSVEYKVSQNVLCGEEIVIKCHLNGPLSNIMKAESTALVIPASCKENEVKQEHGLNDVVMVFVVYCGLLTVIAVSFFVCCITLKYTNRTRSTTSVPCNGVHAGDCQESFLDSETREAGGQIPNGTPLCNANGTDEV